MNTGELLALISIGMFVIFIIKLTCFSPKKQPSDRPSLQDGEVYAGAIITPDGTGHHVILLDGDNDDAEWNEQMEWAKSIGGELPDRVEQALLFAHLKDRFQERAYWSNTPHAAYSNYAWYQYFDFGYQDNYYKSARLRARAVRRIAIQ